MRYINVGVYAPHNKSKKALKEAMAADPLSVSFYGTSPFTPFGGTVADLPEGDVLQVTGPDPATNRKWYATVRRNGDNVKVS